MSVRQLAGLSFSNQEAPESQTPIWVLNALGAGLEKRDTLKTLNPTFTFAHPLD